MPRPLPIAAALLTLAPLLHAAAQATPPDLPSLLRAHHYAEALAAADAIHPPTASTLLFRGLALNGLHRTPEALADLRRALSLDPSLLQAAEAGAQIAYTAHDASEDAFLGDVLRLEPANSTAHAMHGVLALEHGDCPAALADAAQAPQLAASDPATARRLTLCQAQTSAEAGNLDAAATTLASLPPDPTTTLDLASIRLQQKQPAAAIALLSPDRATLSAPALNLLGAALAQQDKLPEAIQAYRDSIARDPRDDRSYLDLATLSMEHQSPDVALSVLDAGLKANPANPRLLVTRGTVYAQLGKDDLAQADFEHANRLAPSSTLPTLGLGVLLREESNLDQAETVLDKKLAADPNDPVLSFMLADVLIRKGADPGDPAFTRALALLHTAISRQPDLAPAHALLGKLDVKQNQPAAAVPELERAIALQPTDRTALNQLIAAYRRLNRTADADRISAQLSASVAAERADEVEKNRTHLTLADPAAAPASAPASAPAASPAQP